jgi:hypothetical protein
LLVDFANKTLHAFPGLLSREYALLNPKFLYNIPDTKFHTLDAALRPTGLPRRLALAPAIPPPEAAYHLIPLR